MALLHDAHNRLTPTETGWLGRQLEPHNLYWLEDPTPAALPQAYQQIRRQTAIPLAAGETFNTVHQASELISRQLIDYLRMTPSHAGGLTHLAKIAAYADIYSIKLGCHAPTDVSPITVAAAAHLGLAIPNFGIQEHVTYSDEVAHVFNHTYQHTNGGLDLPDQPGLGVDLDETVATSYPYKAAYLPINRTPDGAVTDW